MKIKVKKLEKLDKIKGLLGEKSPQAVMFKTRFGIHTFGLKFPIDVLILDKNGRIIKLKESLLPNKVLFWNIKYDTVVELPEGSIKGFKTKIGDLIQLAS